MLCAEQKLTGEIVTAYLASKASGPFVCPDCRDEVILKTGRRTVNHFAHVNPLVCRYAENESDEHRRCKMEIFRALQNEPHVRNVALERPLGITALLKPFTLRADWADEMLERVKEEKKQSAQSDALMAEQKRAEIEKINLRLQKLLDSFLDEIIDRETYVAEKAKWMSQKKSLEEQSTALLKGRANWLEPFQSWILTARNAGGIAVSGSPQERKALAQKVFGSNLVLDCKKARGSCVKPWSYLLDNTSSGGMVPTTGLEPVRCYPLEPESSASANSATWAQ